ncbi:MAG TPA: hypothetical protein VGC77_11135 [Rhodopseudomonas sp.]|uniref:hypothetical protein n=1 Tax=Rhodopseudomonas sp. TaxID=1078 RepID=UPI002EDAB0CE
MSLPQTPEPELSLEIDPLSYFGLRETRRIKDRLVVTIADRAYLPDTTDLQRDWLSSVAAPAFRLLRDRRGEGACRAFASIGTGSGADALAAIEIFGAETIGITDLFGDVVDTAAGNIRRNLRPGVDVTLHSGAGDLLSPLRERGLRFDVVYENLPNLPLAEAGHIEVGRTSAAFIPPRGEAVPDFVKEWLLVLHYLALVEARDLLNPGGTVVSVIGARLPLEILSRMAVAAGYTPAFLTYSWKVQADPVDVIGSYAQWQRGGLGPFYFYPAARLAEAFAVLDPQDAGRNALSIEASLKPARLDAVEAWDAFQRGERIGHTVAVLQSGPSD